MWNVELASGVERRWAVCRDRDQLGALFMCVLAAKLLERACLSVGEGEGERSV
jgi:hypothetical protein